jgi:hypothetical protein
MGHPNIGWSEHYEHLVSHHSNGTCAECPDFQQKIGLPGIFKLSALEIMNMYPNEAPCFDIAKAVEKKFELSDLFKSIQVRKKIKEKIESFVRSVNRKVPSSSSLPLDGGGNSASKRCTHYGDIRLYNSQHVIDFNLHQCTIGQNPLFCPRDITEDMIKEYASLLYLCKIIKPALMLHERQAYHQGLICLHDEDVKNDKRFLYLLNEP